ncbi:MAG: hypothetical protein ACSHX3_11835 [Litorimonas sp.]
MKTPNTFYVIIIFVSWILSLTGCTPGTTSQDETSCNTNLSHLSLYPRYGEPHCADGLAIYASDAVSDDTRDETVRLASIMLSTLAPDHAQMIANNTVMIVLAETETVTSVNEFAFLKNDRVTNWDQRARGFGASRGVPITLVAEEDILCRPTDPYVGESIFVHEFAHTIMMFQPDAIAKQSQQTLQTLYRSAIDSGLFENTYAATNADEYFAEGVQSYFSANISRDVPDGIHNFVSTPDELNAYDPELFAFIDAIFAGRTEPVPPTFCPILD